MEALSTEDKKNIIDALIAEYPDTTIGEYTQVVRDVEAVVASRPSF